MRCRFSELGLCEFDWKAEQLATDNYPNWASNNLQVVKGETSNTLLTHTKRCRFSAGHISKKAKIESHFSTSVEADSALATPSSLAASSLPPIDSSRVM